MAHSRENNVYRSRRYCRGHRYRGKGANKTKEEHEAVVLDERERNDDDGERRQYSGKRHGCNDVERKRHHDSAHHIGRNKPHSERQSRPAIAFGLPDKKRAARIDAREIPAGKRAPPQDHGEPWPMAAEKELEAKEKYRETYKEGDAGWQREHAYDAKKEKYKAERATVQGVEKLTDGDDVGFRPLRDGCEDDRYFRPRAAIFFGFRKDFAKLCEHAQAPPFRLLAYFARHARERLFANVRDTLFLIQIMHSGGGEIRTLGALRHGGFRNHCTRPLCDPSAQTLAFFASCFKKPYYKAVFVASRACPAKL